MNWIIRFLGLYDRRQKERTAEVSQYAENKKSEFDSSMLKLQVQAKRVHRATQIAHKESIRLNKIVDDVTNKIALATGGK